MSNTVYWKEWQGVDGIIMGLEIWGGAAAALSSPTRVEIPTQCHLALGKLNTKYDGGRPLGLPLTPALTITFDMAAFNANSDMVALRGLLLSPVAAGAGTMQFSGSSRTFDTATTFRVYRTTEPGGTQTTLFVGAQRGRPSRKGKILGAGMPHATVVYEITVLHLARIALEEVRPDDIRTLLLNTAIGKFFDEVFDLFFRYNSINHFVSLGPVGYKIAAYRYFDLIYVIQNLAEQVYKAYMRSTKVFFVFTSNVGGFAGTPLDHWKLRKQNYQRNAAPGDSINVYGGTSPSEDAYFPAAVYPVGESHLTTSKWIAGALCDDGKGVDNSASIYRFRHAWDLLAVEVQAWKCKGQIRVVNGDIELRFAQVYNSPWAYPAARHTLEAAEINQQEFEFLEGEGSLREVKAITPGLSGLDITETTDYVSGTESEESLSIRRLFHTHPHCGAAADATSRYSVGSWKVDVCSAVNGVHMGVRIRTISPFTLYYKERISVDGDLQTTGDVLVRCHSECKIDDGIIPVFDYGDRPPSPGWPTVSSGAVVMIDLWWAQVRSLFLFLQVAAGTGWAVVASTILTWQWPTITTWEKLRVTALQIDPQWLGEVVEIKTGATANANVWLNGTDTYLSGFPLTDCHIIEIELDLDTGEEEVTVQQIRNSYN